MRSYISERVFAYTLNFYTCSFSCTLLLSSSSHLLFCTGKKFFTNNSNFKIRKAVSILVRKCLCLTRSYHVAKTISNKAHI